MPPRISIRGSVRAVKVYIWQEVGDVLFISNWLEFDLNRLLTRKIAGVASSEAAFVVGTHLKRSAGENGFEGFYKSKNSLCCGYSSEKILKRESEKVTM